MKRIVFLAVALATAPAFAQAPVPTPASYTFTLTPAETDALYAALERASEAQALVTGERSPRFDALMAKVLMGVNVQKAATAKAAEKPKDEPKTETPKQ
jgi:hypothetical protein